MSHDVGRGQESAEAPATAALGEKAQRRPWAGKDLQILTENAGSMSVKELAEQIDRDEAAIRKYCSRRGISLNTNGKAPWGTKELKALLETAGSMSANELAEQLPHTKTAIKKYCSRNGISLKIKDGMSRRALCKELHVRPRTLQKFINAGKLKIANPQIQLSSLIKFCQTRCRELGVNCNRLERQLARYQEGLSPEQIAEITDLPLETVAAWMTEGQLKHKHGRVPFRALQEFVESLGENNHAKQLKKRLSRFHYSSARVAGLVNVPETTVQSWIAKRWLQLTDPYITYDSVEEFLRTNGDDVNWPLFSKGKRKWAAEELKARIPQDANRLLGFQKHLGLVRTANCGREIRGNAYFRHVKHCKKCRQQASVLRIAGSA
jgi:plasmid maintenance system antidote protein VapI